MNRENFSDSTPPTLSFSLVNNNGVEENSKRQFRPDPAPVERVRKYPPPPHPSTSPTSRGRHRRHRSVDNTGGMDNIEEMIIPIDISEKFIARKRKMFVFRFFDCSHTLDLLRATKAWKTLFRRRSASLQRHRRNLLEPRTKLRRAVPQTPRQRPPQQPSQQRQQNRQHKHSNQ